MPGKKKKYNARFPPARIKKIMQSDEEVGKVAAAVPVIISRALELFVENLLAKAKNVVTERRSRTLTPSHIKLCIQAEARFDFLKELVSGVADLQGEVDGDTPISSSSQKEFVFPDAPPSDDASNGSKKKVVSKETKDSRITNKADNSNSDTALQVLKSATNLKRSRGRPKKSVSPGIQPTVKPKRILPKVEVATLPSQNEGDNGTQYYSSTRSPHELVARNVGQVCDEDEDEDDLIPIKSARTNGHSNGPLDLSVRNDNIADDLPVLNDGQMSNLKDSISGDSNGCDGVGNLVIDEDYES